MPSRDPLVQQVLSFHGQHDLLPQKGYLLVAVSGGMDSMCLLSVLHHLAPELGYTLCVAHYHHGLRGDEADRDADFVRDTCLRLHLPFYTERGDVATTARDMGAGIEETARLLRYRFLNHTADTLSQQSSLPCAIATAHNADDNGETLLLHLVRGTGLQGLTGIAPKSGRLIRPLLCCSRSQIQDYLLRHHLPHVEDSSNTDCAYSRNFLRHQVIPLLRQLNPNLTAALNRTAGILSEENQLLTAHSQAVLSHIKWDPSGLSLPLSDLADLPTALRPRGVQLVYGQLCPGEILSLSHRQAVVALAESATPSGQCMLPGGVTVRRQYDRLILQKNAPAEDALSLTPLPLPGDIRWGPWHILATRVIYQGQTQTGTDLYLSCPGEALLIRPRTTGDRIAPPHRPTKTLKKWMIENKIPQHLRDSVPVFTDSSDHILAVPGIGVAKDHAPIPGSPACHIALKGDSV